MAAVDPCTHRQSSGIYLHHWWRADGRVYPPWNVGIHLSTRPDTRVFHLEIELVIYGRKLSESATLEEFLKLKKPIKTNFIYENSKSKSSRNLTHQFWSLDIRTSLIVEHQSFSVCARFQFRFWPLAIAFSPVIRKSESMLSAKWTVDWMPIHPKQGVQVGISRDLAAHPVQVVSLGTSDG